MSQSGNNTSYSTSTVSVTQVLTVPIGQNLANPLTRTLVPSMGSIAFDSVVQKLFVGRNESVSDETGDGFISLATFSELESFVV